MDPANDADEDFLSFAFGMTNKNNTDSPTQKCFDVPSIGKVKEILH